MFVPCHCHDERSNFRGRDALVRTTELIDYAHELGHKGVAITNHETISSSLHLILVKFNWLDRCINSCILAISASQSS